MPKFVGELKSLALFSNEEHAVVIDTSLNLVVEVGTTAALSTRRKWTPSKSALNSKAFELAELALSAIKPEPLLASGRLYTIPAGVKAEAIKALKWRKEHKRGGTPVGINTARTLARGGQIGIEKIRHIAKYFPRHEVDKKGKGWDMGEDNFPSNGRIAWALWGGDAAWRWSRAIVERENKKALKAGGYDETYGADLDSFKDAMTLDESMAPEFLARVRLDGSGIDRIYKIDITGQVYVWDDGIWDNLGHIEGDIWTYDRALDDPYDSVEKSHIQIDPESAISICARMTDAPFAKVSVFELDKEEALMASLAVFEEDWELVDAVVAATPPPVPGDGVYTPEERSKNVAKQIRDASGRFAKAGNTVRTADNRTGKISKVNPQNQSVTVDFEDGTSAELPASQVRTTTQAEPTNVTGIQPTEQDDRIPLDTSGILGEPRTPIDRPQAQIPGTLPALTQADLGQILGNWDAWVAGQRASYAPQKDYTKKDYLEYPANWNPGEPTTYPTTHPLVSDVLKKNENKPQQSFAVIAAAQEKEVALTPQTSDVEPLYFAIVAPDDPSAVLKLVSLVPATNKSTAPVAYVREAKKWNKDDGVLADLKSPTPPPVIALEGESLNSVLLQVDGVQASASYEQVLMVLWGPNAESIKKAEESYLDSLVAAGGADRNRGNAETLRRYWTRGKGALKIRWGTPGDWKRCVRYLRKYLGVRAKGYCQLRHKEATGVYTGSRLNPGRKDRNFEAVSPTIVTEEDMLLPIEEIIDEIDDLYDDEWEPEEDIVNACRELAKCSDKEFEALIAAGGLDPNRGNAEELRRYWTRGEGALKIRWGTPGDWTRCVRFLSKYLGPRAKGYCALRHKEVTGLWTGDTKHRQIFGRRKGGFAYFSNGIISTEEQIIAEKEKLALKNEAKAKFNKVLASINNESLTAGAYEDELGPKFYIPLVIPENLESGDGRKFKKGAISFREMPLPLMWQVKTSSGHDGSVVVGRIDYMERTDDGIGNAYGYFDTGANAKEVVRLIKNGFIKGVSADMDQFEATEQKSEAADDDEDKSLGKDKIIINKARVMGITIVPKPAFQECKIYLEEATNTNQEETVISDGIYAEEVDPNYAESLVACGLVAGSVPVTPPKAWFSNPNLDKPTPLTITEDGRVYGHIAAWAVDHIGLSKGVKPPRSKSNYSYFHTGVVRTEEGADVPVGQLTLAGGHASLEASAAQAVKHYDDTNSAFADVHAGEDSHGIWVAGSLRPGITPEQVRAARASAPSGDWRPIRGSLELVAVCQVNVPGFPIARARVASGAVMALVAAGAQTLALMKSDPVSDLNARISKLEGAAIVSEKAEELQAIKQKFEQAKQEFGSYEDYAYMSKSAREKLAEKGQALPDGSYPIRNVSDLKNAIQAYGRAKPSKRKEVRDHIRKRAKALGKSDLVPENWKEASVDEMRARIASASEQLGKAFATEAENPTGDAPVAESTPGEQEDIQATDTVESGSRATGRYTPKTQPRDEHGKFRKVLARLKQDLGTAGLQSIVEEVRATENLHELGNYSASASAASKLLNIVDRLDAGALNKVSLENVRSSAAELGKVIANLPLGFNNQADKIRYSDLPPSLRDLMDNMIERVEAKIGKEDADVATQALKSFKAGSDVYSQGEISSEMSKLLRLLT